MTEISTVQRFETSYGSIYTYLPDGRIQRLKNANQLCRPKDIALFVPPEDELETLVDERTRKYCEESGYTSTLLQAIHALDKTLFLIRPDGTPIRNLEGIKQETDLQLACSPHTKFPRYYFAIPISIAPSIGYSPFDANITEQGTLDDRHFGHPITRILYTNGNITQRNT